MQRGMSVSGIDRCVGSTRQDLFRARLLAPVCIQLGEAIATCEGERARWGPHKMIRFHCILACYVLLVINHGCN